MGDLNPGLHNWGWGGQITMYALIMVFLMLFVLMFSLLGITALDARLAAKASVEEAEEEAPAITGGDSGQTDLAAIAIATHSAVGAGGGLSAAHLGALGVTLETVLHRSSSVPALIANQSTTGLAESRWVAAGRGTQTQSWQRS